MDEARHEEEKLEAHINRVVRENLPHTITVREIATETKKDPLLQKLISTLGIDFSKRKLDPDLADYCNGLKH